MTRTGIAESELLVRFQPPLYSDIITRWTDHFQNVRSRQPGPEPGCRAPPPEGMKIRLGLVCNAESVRQNSLLVLVGLDTGSLTRALPSIILAMAFMKTTKTRKRCGKPDSHNKLNTL